MRYIILFLMLVSVGFGAAITTEGELQTNWEAGGTHTIAAGTYTLTSALLSPSTNLILTPTGDVIIDGTDTHFVIIRDVSVTIGDSTNTYSITFTQGAGNGIDVQADTANTSVTFYNVIIKDPSTGHGYEADGGAGFTVTTTFQDCQVYLTAQAGASDGINISNDLGASDDSNICYVYDTTIYNWGNNAVTAHDTLEYIYAEDCTMYNNGGPTVSSIGNSNVSIIDSTIYNNNGSSHVLNTANTASAYYQGCTIYDNTGTFYTLFHNSTGTAMFENCTVYDSAGDGYRAMYVGDGANLIVKNCSFSGFNANSNSDGILTHAGATISVLNSVFYDMYDCINSGAKTIVQGCIFSEVDNDAITNGTAVYSYDATANGYNNFHNVTSDMVSANAAELGADTIKSTDLQLNPQFADVANQNFTTGNGTLKTSGVPLPNGTNTPIGLATITSGGSSGATYKGLYGN